MPMESTGPSLIYDADGNLVYSTPGADPDRLELIAEAWEVYRTTGDTTPLILLGIWPEDDEG